MISLQVVRTSFGFHLREYMGSSPPPPPPPLSGVKLWRDWVSIIEKPVGNDELLDKNYLSQILSKWAYFVNNIQTVFLLSIELAL